MKSLALAVLAILSAAPVRAASAFEKTTKDQERAAMQKVAAAKEEFRKARAQEKALASSRSAGQAGQAAAPAAPAPGPGPFRVPAEFSIFERFFAWTNTFDVKAGATSLGVITEKFFSMTKSFTLTDAGNHKVAKARARFFALGSTVDVTDAAGRPIGTIREDILRSLFKVYTLYKVLDPTDRLVATSQKTDWLSTEIVLRDPAGRPIAEVRRDFGANLFRFTDRWDVRVHDRKALDPRMIVMIAAYKSSVDNDRRQAESDDDDRSDDDGVD